MLDDPHIDALSVLEVLHRRGAAHIDRLAAVLERCVHVMPRVNARIHLIAGGLGVGGKAEQRGGIGISPTAFHLELDHVLGGIERRRRDFHHGEALRRHGFDGADFMAVDFHRDLHVGGLFLALAEPRGQRRHRRTAGAGGRETEATVALQQSLRGS